MGAYLTFDRSGTGPAGRRAGRVPSLSTRAFHTRPRQWQVTADVRNQYMAPHIAIFESDADRRRICRRSMSMRTAESLQQEYPEAEITATAMPDRRAFCHSKNIPEARVAMIFSFPTPVIATSRRMRSSTQARFHAPPDHEQECANRAVDLTTGKRAVSMESLFDVPPLRHRACWEKSRPSAFAVHPCIPHTPPPVAGHRRRSPEIYAFSESPF